MNQFFCEINNYKNKHNTQKNRENVRLQVYNNVKKQFVGFSL